IFGKKKEKEEIKKEEKVEEKKSLEVCAVCNQPIHENEEYKTLYIQGKKYLVHVKCFRKAKKMAKKYLGGNIKI
ncbi:MAG: hypothetical protein QW184_02570, partial [Nanopusillaceae archaeon]